MSVLMLPYKGMLCFALAAAAAYSATVFPFIFNFGVFSCLLDVGCVFIVNHSAIF